MEISYVIGDMITGEHPLIIHGCNARGAYASGVAGKLRREIPVAYEAYRSAHETGSPGLRMGDVIWAYDLGDGRRPRIVGNAITQRDYGRDPGRRYVCYEAVRAALRRVNDFVASTQDGSVSIAAIGAIREVGMPLIGCGLGNGRWSVISSIIEAESRCFTPVVYVLTARSLPT